MVSLVKIAPIQWTRHVSTSRDHTFQGAVRSTAALPYAGFVVVRTQASFRLWTRGLRGKQEWTKFKDSFHSVEAAEAHAALLWRRHLIEYVKIVQPAGRCDA